MCIIHTVEVKCKLCAILQVKSKLHQSIWTLAEIGDEIKDIFCSTYIRLQYITNYMEYLETTVRESTVSKYTYTEVSLAGCGFRQKLHHIPVHLNLRLKCTYIHK